MRWKELIIEGVNRYLPMFTPYYENGVIPPNIMAKIEKIEHVMGRQDRVIWMLRWYRFWLFGSQDTPEDSEEARVFLKKQAKLLKDVGQSNLTQAIEDADFVVDELTQFEHYFSLPINHIRTLVFERQSPNEILKQFNDWEEEWIETRDRTVELKSSDKMIIDLGGGWAWFDLNREFCREEGDAMGHCGNTAAYESGDTLLSLREHVYENLWAPHLTFIRHENGFLGEMKGRGNEKPVEKYHAAIFTLLMSDFVEGISGGGYKPENNFSLNDLPDSEVKQIKARKWGFNEYWELMKEGREEEARKLIEMKVHGYNSDYLIDHENEEVILKTYKSVDAFVTYIVPEYDGVYDAVEQAMSEDSSMFNRFKEDYYLPSLKEHVYDMTNYRSSNIAIKFNDDGKVTIVLSFSDFEDAIDPDSDEYAHGGDLLDQDDDWRSFGDYYGFSDDIDEAIMKCVSDRKGGNRDLGSLVALIHDAYSDEKGKFSNGSPTVKHRDQYEFDFTPPQQ